MSAFGHDVLARFETGDLHEFAFSRANRDRPALERFPFDLNENDRPAGIVY